MLFFYDLIFVTDEDDALQASDESTYVPPMIANGIDNESHDMIAD